MGEAFDAACKEVRDTGQPPLVREVMAKIPYRGCEHGCVSSLSSTTSSCKSVAVCMNSMNFRGLVGQESVVIGLGQKPEALLARIILAAYESESLPRWSRAMRRVQASET